MSTAALLLNQLVQGATAPSNSSLPSEVEVRPVLRPVLPLEPECEPGAPAELDDAQLVERARLGHEAAFRELVLRHQQRAFTVAMGLVRDENDAREIVQEAFLRVHRSIDSFQGGSAFFTWLYRIVKNLSIDLLRKPSYRITESLFHYDIEEMSDLPFLAEMPDSDPYAAVCRSEIAASVERGLERLPPYHRSVIEMRELEGLSYEEMAQRAGVSKGTIMSRLFHARRKLQRALAECHQEQLIT